MTWTATLYNPGGAGYADGPLSGARFDSPQAIRWSGSSLYIADTGNNAIRTITGATVATWGTVALPLGITLDAGGKAYVSSNSNIQTIPSGGGASTLFAGVGPGFLDGNGTAARFNSPAGVEFDPGTGNIFVADVGNHAIRMLTPTADVTTLCGTGSAGYVDGVAGVAAFNAPTDIAFGPDANFYVADSNNQAIRRVDNSGTVSTFANVAPHYPTGVAFAADGTLHAIAPTSSGGTPACNVLRINGYGGYATVYTMPTTDFASLAFDAAATLWTTNFFNSTLVKLSPLALGNLGLRDAGAWDPIDALYDAAMAAPNTHHARNILRLKLASGRYAAYYRRDVIAAYAHTTIYSVPDEGVPEQILWVRHSGGWLPAGAMATGAALHTVLITGLLADDGASGLITPDASRQTGSFLTGTSPPRWAMWARRDDAGTVRRHWISVDLGFLQDACTPFHDGYVEFAVAGYAADGLGAGYLWLSGASTDTAGPIVSGGDFNFPPQSLAGATISCFSAANASVTAEGWASGTLLNTWPLSTLRLSSYPGLNTSDPFGPSAASYGTYRHSFDNTAVAGRAVLVFRIEVDTPPGTPGDNMLVCRPRVVIRS